MERWVSNPEFLTSTQKFFHNLNNYPLLPLGPLFPRSLASQHSHGMVTGSHQKPMSRGYCCFFSFFFSLVMEQQGCFFFEILLTVGKKSSNAHESYKPLQSQPTLQFLQNTVILHLI